MDHLFNEEGTVGNSARLSIYFCEFGGLSLPSPPPIGIHPFDIVQDAYR